MESVWVFEMGDRCRAVESNKNNICFIHRIHLFCCLVLFVRCACSREGEMGREGVRASPSIFAHYCVRFGLWLLCRYAERIDKKLPIEIFVSFFVFVFFLLHRFSPHTNTTTPRCRRLVRRCSKFQGIFPFWPIFNVKLPKNMKFSSTQTAAAAAAFIYSTFIMSHNLLCLWRLSQRSAAFPNSLAAPLRLSRALHPRVHVVVRGRMFGVCRNVFIQWLNV